MTRVWRYHPYFMSNPEIVEAPALEPAGFWIRAGGRLLDWVVLGAVGLFVGIVIVVIAGVVAALGRPNQMIASMEKMTFIGWIGSTIATLAYHACFEGLAGTTVGKRLIGLQVLSCDGAPLQFRQGVKRSVGFLVDALFFGAIGAYEMNNSPEKQRIGDRWANTRVVRRRSLPLAMRTATSRMLAAFVVAVSVAGAITAVTQLLEYLWYVR